MRDPIDKWEEDADRFELYGSDPRADLLRRCAAQIREWRRWRAGELLTLSEAAGLTGYRADYLSRLIGQGKLQNYGRKHSPRVRRSELPVKTSPTELQPT
jgi:hypothetical protein